MWEAPLSPTQNPIARQLHDQCSPPLSKGRSIRWPSASVQLAPPPPPPPPPPVKREGAAGDSVWEAVLRSGEGGGDERGIKRGQPGVSLPRQPETFREAPPLALTFFSPPPPPPPPPVKRERERRERVAWRVILCGKPGGSHTESGRKADQKTYFRHTTSRPGDYKIETFRELQARLPERIVEKAVWGMIPKGRRHRRSPAPAPAPSLWGTKGGIHCFTGSDVKGTRLSPPISAPACPPSREGPPARL